MVHHGRATVQVLAGTPVPVSGKVFAGLALMTATTMVFRLQGLGAAPLGGLSCRTPALEVSNVYALT